MNSDAELIEQAESDLRWLVRCPSLIESPLALSLPDPFSTGREMDWSPVLRFHQTKASFRVGYYFESLVQVWLSAIPEVSDLRHGIQVIREKETLGELDFLFCMDGKLHHLEVALKFYLYSADHLANGSHFIGPNASDNFEKKRDRLFQKQIPFGRESFPEVDESHGLVKGMIFYPPGVAPPDRLPEGLNPRHARGVWCFESERSGHSDMAEGGVLPKPFWLSTPAGVEQAARRSGSLDRELIEQEDRLPARPRFVYLPGTEKENGPDRLFLVPESWPGQK